MDIIARIKPLYDDLIAIGFPALMENNEFIRIANDTGFTNEYAEAVNEATSKQQTNWLGLIDGISYQDVLAIFLNRLYNADATKLTELLTPAICKCIDFSYFITSINDLKRDIQLLGATKEQLDKVVVAWDEVSKNYYKKVMVLKSLLTSRATGGDGNEEYFQVIRKDLLAHPKLKVHVPEYVQKSNNLYEYWQFIKHHLPYYAERRFFIKDTFEGLVVASLELNGHAPHETHVNEVVQTVNEQYISETWNKALQRMQDDPEAAITSARALVEVVCKHILDSQNQVYDDGLELPKLYKQVASILNLAPDQHTESIFKQILGGCQTVVEGLGALRNKLGDAHGKSRNKVKPSARHAALAVNLAGSMCSFLLQTYDHIQETSPETN
ncbi:abortive infection family protein [Mucilaginibacter sp. L196]|uniref:abortive infection family protein n=1 Tax=Mucilaginibacter sp. L196 TaxID=1641870 RepID=UPI001C2076B3|nr:abortive infection family protein [Mucilaginibacter sp. L196]